MRAIKLMRSNKILVGFSLCIEPEDLPNPVFDVLLEAKNQIKLNQKTAFIIEKCCIAIALTAVTQLGIEWDDSFVASFHSNVPNGNTYLFFYKARLAPAIQDLEERGLSVILNTPLTLWHKVEINFDVLNVALEEDMDALSEGELDIEDFMEDYIEAFSDQFSQNEAEEKEDQTEESQMPGGRKESHIDLEKGGLSPTSRAYKLKTLADLTTLPSVRGTVVEDAKGHLYLITSAILDEFLDREKVIPKATNTVISGGKVKELRKALLCCD